MDPPIDPMTAAKAEGLDAAMKAAAAKKAAMIGSEGRRRRIGESRALAELVGISPSAISAWGGEVPLARVLQVEAATGVPRHLLRPDYWSAPQADAAA